MLFCESAIIANSRGSYPLVDMLTLEQHSRAGTQHLRQLDYESNLSTCVHEL